MSDESTSRPQPEAPAGGVFGNLPDSRPGTRSPRRDSGRAGKGASGDAPPATTSKRPRAEDRAASQPVAEREVGPAPPRAEPSGRAAIEEEPAKEGGGLEDIAWAGVAAAAEAATIGVRLASRAIEALRGNAEKE